MWNFLWRLGYAPRLIAAEDLPVPAAGDVLFLQCDAVPARAVADRLDRWTGQGGRLVAAGLPDAWPALAPSRTGWVAWRAPGPYGAIGFVDVAGAPHVIAPPGWSAGRFVEHGLPPGAAALVSIGGERQTPGRALVEAIPGAPLLDICGRRAFVNANPFAAFQAWLQGQEDLRPWLHWRHRLFWLDEWVSDMAGVLQAAGVIDLSAPRPGIPGLDAQTVVLRHDVDHSRDTTYLQLERERQLPATYAVLDDSNRRFWTGQLAGAAHVESAFHYTTGRRHGVASARARWRGERGAVWGPWRAAVSGRGLLRQVRRARALGIGTSTLHRHLHYLVYPEWVDALDAALQAEPVLGGSSLFRAHVLRWGGATADVGEWPDAQFPLWLPFRLAHAADQGRVVGGWESTSLMETEPALVAQLLDHHVPYLPQRVLTLGFHPAHAHAPAFAAGGSAASFAATIDLLRERRVAVRTLREVYQLAADAAA
jgi:hypothetical protein